MDKARSKTTASQNHSVSFTLPSRLFGSESSKTVLKCIDCHAAGEPARVVLSGIPDVFPKDCTTALQKRSYMMEHMDHFRKLLLWEPRGYPCQNVNFIFRANCDDDGNELSSSSAHHHEAPIQYVIGEQNSIYPVMSGHNTICVATALLECGVVEMQEPISRFTLEAPAGPISITAKCSQGKATSITLVNAPSFVEMLDVVVDVPHGIGPVTCDIAYGGMWYAVVDVQQFQTNPALKHLAGEDNSGMLLKECNASRLCRVGEMIKVACREQYPVQHPTLDYPGVDILAFCDDGEASSSPNSTSAQQSRNAVVMSNNVLDWKKPATWTAMLDRSPCGTGTCAVMAVKHARGILKVGEPFVHESIIGTKFIGTILEETRVGKDNNGRDAILPQIEGSAYVTQYSEVVVDSHDPFQEGYRVSDIW